MKALRSGNEKLSIENKRLSEELSEKVHMLDSSANMFKQYKEQIAQLEKDRDALGQESGDVKSEVEKLGLLVASERERKIDMDRQIDELGQRVEKSDKLCREAEEKLVQLSKQKGLNLNLCICNFSYMKISLTVHI